MDFENIVLKKLDKIQDDVNVLSIENVKQTACIEQNTRDLADHKEGVIQNRRRIEIVEEKLKPLTVKQLAKRVAAIVGGLGVVVSTIYGITRLFGGA